MDLVYIYHSGFALIDKDITIIIDFYKDSVSEDKGLVHESILQRPGRIYVLSSHFHADHFNHNIMKWNDGTGRIKYIFSKDIYRRRKIAKEDAVFLTKGDEYKDDRIRIKAYGSTDVGISFLIELDGKKIFHAGDLNNWHWMDECDEAEWKGYENNFLKELDDIYKDNKAIDLVMFPVDPRLGSEYQRGALQFAGKIKTGTFMPMHFGEDYEAANRFQNRIAKDMGINSPLITKRGEIFEL